MYRIWFILNFFVQYCIQMALHHDQDYGANNDNQILI